MISKADNSHNVVKKKQTTPLKSGLVLAIKLSEKKEMLAATITDNDRIGPSLASFVLYWAGWASLKIFMTAGIHILICWAFFSAEISIRSFNSMARGSQLSLLFYRTHHHHHPSSKL